MNQPLLKSTEIYEIDASGTRIVHSQHLLKSTEIYEIDLPGPALGSRVYLPSI